MYAYEWTFAELVNDLSDAVDQAFDRWGQFVPMENLLLLAGVDISDSSDSQRCSKALQVLRKRGRIRYCPSYRQWEILDSNTIFRSLSKVASEAKRD